MSRYSVYMLDHRGQYQPSLGGIPIPGDVIGVHGVSFNPEGSVLDKIGTVKCSAELVDYRNLALRSGTSLQLLDNETKLVMARAASITSKNVTVSITGHRVDIVAPDLLDELRRTSTTFATAPGEAVRTTLARLAGIRTETTWGYATDMDTALDGIDFSAPGVSVAQAYVKFAQERFAHVRREGANGGRTVGVGRYGAASGITLSGAAENPTAAHRTNPAIRQILEGGLEVAETGTIVNMLIPTGGGNGIGQLTLGPLYEYTGETSLGNGVFQSGPTTFTGYDPVNRPLRRRPAQDGGQASVDGMEYFIQDDLSVNGDGSAAHPGYGVWEDHWQQQQIAPILNGSSVDLTNAAVALYQAATAHLAWNSAPHSEYKLTTDGAGDLRNLAGLTVRVIYKGPAKRRTQAGTQEFMAVDLNLSLTVLEIMVSEGDDETLSAVWTLSDNGQYAASETSIVIAGLDQVSYGHYTAQTAVGFPLLPFDDFIDNTAVGPITRTFPGNGGTVQVVQAVLSLFVAPVRAPVIPQAHGHDVATAPMNSDVNAIPHDVGNNGGLGIAVWDDTGEHVVTTGEGYEYQPDPHVSLNRQSTKPATAKPVYFDGTAWYWDGSSTVVAGVAGRNISFGVIPPTSGGKGGTVAKTTGAADIAAGSATPGTVGGSVPKATHAYQEGTTKVGALSTAAGKVSQAIGWGVQTNPAPLPSVTAKIGGAVAGTVTNAGRLDVTGAVVAAGSGRTDFTLTLSVGAAPSGNPTGLCRVYGLLQLRTIVSSLNAPL